MPIHAFQYTMNAGELGPSMEGRVDHARYQAGLSEALNVTTLLVGGAERRPGLRFVAPVKDHSRQVRLLPFEFSVTQAYVLEFGHGYVRFYKNGARLESPPGTPIEVASPYQEGELFQLQTAQSADVMWIVHSNHAPRKLLRFSDTLWSLQLIPFDPPPSIERPVIMPGTLTLSATSGSPVTATWDLVGFFHADVGRTLSLVSSQGSLARAVITGLVNVAPDNQAILNILSPFPSVLLPHATWQLEGPLGSGLKIIALGPEPLRGTLCKALLRQRDILNPELVADGGFTSGLNSWANHSGLTLASGNHTGSNGNFLSDNKHFPAHGVRIGMRAINHSLGTSGTISSITPDGASMAVNNTFNNGNSYSIQGTEGAVAQNGGAQLNGGMAGTAWIEQGIVTTNGESYRITFDVMEAPLSVQVGSVSKASDLYAEASFPIGKEREVIFIATGPTSYIQFRTNQPVMTRVDNISCKSISASGWRNPTDLNKFIKAGDGVFEIVGIDNLHSANVVVRTPPNQSLESDFPANAWTLEEAAWTPANGFPRAISFHQQRLGFAGTLLQPLTVWQSETGAYEQFGSSSLADSSLDQEFSANTMNTILWMTPFRDLLVGTAAAEHLLRGVNGPLTPSNGEQLPQTSIGSEGLPPLRIDNALILLQRGGQQIKEVNIDEVGQSTRGVDHTFLADHITESGLKQWVIQTKPIARVIAVRHDGVLIMQTYEQVEQVRGWQRHTTDGAFESVCVIPVNTPSNEQTEEVYVAVRRTIGNETRRFVERLVPGLQLDSALAYHGPLATTLSGLGHLEGKVVRIVDLSSSFPVVLDDKTVVAGAVTLEHAVTAAEVGLPYVSRLRTMRPEIPLRNGTLQGRKKRWMKITARVLGTLGILINGEQAILRNTTDLMDAGMVPRDGDMEAVVFGNDEDGYITVEQVDPLPMTVIGLYGELEVED